MRSRIFVVFAKERIPKDFWVDPRDNFGDEFVIYVGAIYRSE